MNEVQTEDQFLQQVEKDLGALMASITIRRSMVPPNTTGTTPPTVPGTPTITLVGYQVTGTFAASVGGSFGVAGYKIYRKIGAGSYTYWTSVTTNSFTDASLGLSQTVQYKASAYDTASTPNESAQSSASNSVTTPSTPAINTTAPVVPFILPAGSGTGTVTIRAMQSTTHHDGTSPGSGVTAYPWKRGSTSQTDITAPASNTLPVPTTYDIGSASPVLTRVGVDWNMTCGGASGLDTTSDGIGLQSWAYTSLPNVHTTLTAFTGVDSGTFPGNYGGAGVMLRESSAAGSKFIAAYTTFAGYAYCKWRSTTNGSVSQAYIAWPSILGKLAIQTVGDGSFNVYIDGGSGDPTLIVTLTAADITLAATGIAGVFGFSLTANTITASFTNIGVVPYALVTNTFATSSTETLTIAAKNGSATSSYSHSVTGTAGGSGGATPWIPGAWMYSPDGIKLGGGNLSQAHDAIDMLRAGPSSIKGMTQLFYFRAMFNSGSFDGSTSGCCLDDIYTRITGYVSGSRGSATYSSPRYLGLYFFPQDYFHVSATNTALPDSLVFDSSLGASPVAGEYGYWWKQGASTDSSIIAYWRTAVAAWIIAKMQLLADHVLPDGWKVSESPYIPWVSFPIAESDPGYVSPSVGADPSYNETTYLSCVDSIMAAMVTQFPNTRRRMFLNWTDNQSVMQSLFDKCDTYKFDIAGPDVFTTADSGSLGQVGTGLTQAQAFLKGSRPGSSDWWQTSATAWDGSGTDYRGSRPYSPQVQATETIWIVQRAPQDLFDRMVTELHAQMVEFEWDMGYSPSVDPFPPWDANWLGSETGGIGSWTSADGGVLAVLTTNSYPYTSRPAGY